MKVVDRLGRELRTLRVSVTDRCNFRCFFCMPPGRSVEFLERNELLTYEEIRDVVSALTTLGINKVRITGGEPLLRANIDRLVRMLSSLGGVRDVALTTNGYNLHRKAESLKDAGLKRITVSLPTLRYDRFSSITGRGVSLNTVIEGIERAMGVGLLVKINTVVIRGVNEDEILSIAEFCRERGIVLRFIEYMDVGTLNGWSPDKVFTAREIISVLKKRYALEELGRDKGETATLFRCKDTGLEVGIIASISQPFCRDCTRLRLSADGKLYTCLFSRDGIDIKALLRGGASGEELARFIKGVWERREDRYSELRSSQREATKVEMFKVGG